MRKKLSMLLAMLLVCVMTVGLLKGVTVDAASSKVKLSETKKILYVGEELQLELIGAKGEVEWSTSSKKKATVSDGLVTAVKKGSATIKAKDTATGKTYKCKITVKKNALSKKKVSLKAGEKYELSFKGNVNATWKSSDESVVTVENGKLTALKKGSATITAKIGSAKFTCKVTVSGKVSEVKDDPVTLTMWNISTKDSPNGDIYEKAIVELEKDFPNVKVVWEGYDSEDYKVKIKAALAAGELPDIYFTWSGAYLKNFVDAGAAYCMDDALKPYVKKGDLTKVMLENATYDGKSYGAPLTMNIVTFFANKELLGKVGYSEMPKTYNGLIECCDKLIKKGIVPFGCSLQEIWCITEYLESIIVKSIGAEALNDIYAGKASFDNPGIIDAVIVLQDMIDRGYFDTDAKYASNDEIACDFVDGKYAFYINGSWNCGRFAGEPNLEGKVQISEFPVVNSANSQLGELIGGPSETLAVSAKSKNAKVAAEYAAALSKLVCKYSYLDGNGLPTWTVDYDDNEVNELTKEVTKICAEAKAYALFGDTALKGDDVEVYLQYVYALFTGQMDAEGFVKGLAKDIH